jgi:hypothetical protein
VDSLIKNPHPTARTKLLCFANDSDPEIKSVVSTALSQPERTESSTQAL